MPNPLTLLNNLQLEVPPAAIVCKDFLRGLEQPPICSPMVMEAVTLARISAAIELA